MVVYIYGLKDPITEKIRYVGKAQTPRRRLTVHLHRAKAYKTHVYQWIRSLLRLGLRPDLVILEEVEHQFWPEAEKKWIAYFKRNGNYLTNATDGGDAGTATYGRLGKKNSLEHIEKTRLGRVGKPVQRSPLSDMRRAEGVRRYYASKATPVYQYSRSGEFIKEWPSTVSAATEVLKNKQLSSNIRVSCTKENRLAGGFLWRFFKANSIEPYVRRSVHNKGITPSQEIRDKISKTKKGVGWSQARRNSQYGKVESKPQ